MKRMSQSMAWTTATLIITSALGDQGWRGPRSLRKPHTWSSSSSSSSRPSLPSIASVKRLGHFAGIIPLLYQLRVRAPVTFNSTTPPHLPRIRFQGRLRMEFIATEMISTIYLHAKELEITSEEIRIRRLGTLDWERIQDARLSSAEEALVIRLRKNLQAHRPYELLIPQFVGDVQPGFSLGVFRGFVHQTSSHYYYSTATQFQLSSARSAFPCVDLPHFKANLSLTLVHPPNSKALGNMNNRSPTRQRRSGWKETFLEVTPKLPTYTMAWVVLPNIYERLDKSSLQGHRLSLHYNPIKISKDLSEEIMRYITFSLNAFLRYFEKPLALEKIDFVLLPEFVVQGMENFGLITLSEDYMSKQRPAYRLSLVAHDAHQWFSNAVTVRDWSELCFQEGITDHYARVVVSAFFGVGEDWDEYIGEKYITAMLAETRAEPPKPLILPSNASLSQVSSRCFGKGVFVINGMAQLTGSDEFRSRVTTFLRRHDQDLYSIQDFVSLFDDVKVDGSKPVSEYLKFWYSNGGYPSLFVQRDYEGGGVSLRQEHLHLSQGRLIRTRKIWPIPLSGRLRNVVWRGPVKLLNESEVSGPVAGGGGGSSSAWLHLNSDFAFFYRVNYDVENWRLLAEELRRNGESFSMLSRAQLYYDFCFFQSFALIPESEDVKEILLQSLRRLAQDSSKPLLRKLFAFILSSCTGPK